MSTAKINTPSPHDALPICWTSIRGPVLYTRRATPWMYMETTGGLIRTLGKSNNTMLWNAGMIFPKYGLNPRSRSEEHTSELQSHSDLVCRLLLEKQTNRPR